MATGWGLNKNDCARYLFLALYLDPERDFEPVPMANEIFPDSSHDLFGKFLERKLVGPLPDQIKEFLKAFQWLSPSTR